MRTLSSRRSRHCLPGLRLQLALLILAALLLPVPAAADGEAKVRELLARYIEASNSRDQQALLAIFDRNVHYLDIVRRSRPTLLDRKEFEAELPHLIESWNRYNLTFSISEIRRLEVEDDLAEIDFVLKINGRWFVIPFVRRVLKEFRLIRRGSNWTILEDWGKWL